MAARDELVVAIAGRYAQADRAERAFVRGRTEKKPGLHRLPAGGKWIRTSGSGASGEADANLPVKDRHR